MITSHLVYGMILFGSLLMVSNVCRYVRFLFQMNDVISTERGSDARWKISALVLLVFFLVGYVLVGWFRTPGLLVAGILFGGSVFVSIMLTLLFKLVSTVKTRGIEVVEVLIGVIEARDPNLNGHSRYVQGLTMLLYDALPQSMRKKVNRTSLEYAALMHDVGKLGVPENILNKPDKLDDSEWEVMRTHPQVGVRILEPLHSFDSIKDWIRCHHERVDGTGYYGVRGDDIPLAARMIAIADTYSAITMRRSYKPPRSHEEAMRIIRECAGTQLDSALVDVFERIPKEKLVACAPQKANLFD